MKRRDCWDEARCRLVPLNEEIAIRNKQMAINLPSSKPQAEAASYLEGFRKLYLHQALSNAVETVDLHLINAELDKFAPGSDLRRLASRGIRGELVFALPIMLSKKPNLLGYYR